MIYGSVPGNNDDPLDPDDIIYILLCSDARGSMPMIKMLIEIFLLVAVMSLWTALTLTIVFWLDK